MYIYIRLYIYTHIIYICIYLSLYTHHCFKVGGRTQNVSYIFEGVFEGGLDNVNLHFEGILKTLPAQTTPGGRSATNFTHLRGESQINVSYILVWSPLKSSPKRVVMLYIILQVIYYSPAVQLFDINLLGRAPWHLDPPPWEPATVHRVPSPEFFSGG